MRPNILFIVADDLNSWIGTLGTHPDVRTPNIDALARRGGLYVNAYCSAPYCNASRMGVFTGCLPSTTGIYHNEPLWDVPGRRPTIVELLRASGYYTFGAGKVFHGVFDYATAGKRGDVTAAWQEIENRHFLWDDFRQNRHEPLPDDRPRLVAILAEIIPQEVPVLDLLPGRGNVSALSGRCVIEHSVEYLAGSKRVIAGRTQ